MSFKSEKVISRSHVKMVEGEKSGTVDVYEVKTQRKKEPAFYKTYVDDMGKMNGLSGGECHVLRCALRYMTYDNMLTLRKPQKDGICSETKLSMETVNKAIRKFIKQEIMFRLSPGVFTVNAYLFGKGDYENLYKIRLQIVYSSKGKLIEVDFSKKEKSEKPKDIIKDIKGSEEDFER